MAAGPFFTIKSRLDFGGKPVTFAMARQMDIAAFEGAQQVRRLAQRLVPVDTGHLRSTIQIDKERSRVWNVGALAFYAGFVEFGTIHMDAQPYMRPAIAASRSTILRGMSDRGGRVVRRDYV